MIRKKSDIKYEVVFKKDGVELVVFPVSKNDYATEFGVLGEEEYIKKYFPGADEVLLRAADAKKRKVNNLSVTFSKEGSATKNYKTNLKDLDTETKKYDSYAEFLSANDADFVMVTYSANGVKKRVSDFVLSSDTMFHDVTVARATLHNEIVDTLKPNPFYRYLQDNNFTKLYLHPEDANSHDYFGRETYAKRLLSDYSSTRRVYFAYKRYIKPYEKEAKPLLEKPLFERLEDLAYIMNDSTLSKDDRTNIFNKAARAYGMSGGCLQEITTDHLANDDDDIELQRSGK